MTLTPSRYRLIIRTAVNVTTTTSIRTNGATTASVYRAYALGSSSGPGQYPGSIATHQLTDRLALAEKIGAIAIDDSKVDPVQAVLDETMGLGADRGCECVGYQAHDPQGNEDTAATLNMLINAVRFTGGIGTVGVFVPQDPGAQSELAKQGKAAIAFGTLWFKGQTMGSGQARVKRYNRRLRDLIAAGKATPSWIVSHEISLDQAADAYKNFDARSKGWTKVLIKPGMSNGKKEN